MCLCPISVFVQLRATSHELKTDGLSRSSMVSLVINQVVHTTLENIHTNLNTRHLNRE